MSKTAITKKPKGYKTGYFDFPSYLDENFEKVTLPAIFSVMRALKKVNPGDAYLENYLHMKGHYGPHFHDTYQLLWAIGTMLAPRRILEIGTRTGISLCQLLFAHADLKSVEKIVCVDPFDQWTSPNLVRANLAYLGLPHDPDTVMIHPITSDLYFQQTGTNIEPFDYILVDGDHSQEACRKDLENSHNLISKSGVIVCDDLSTAPGECGLIVVWEAFKKAHEKDYHFYEDLRGKGCGWCVRL